LKKDERFKYFQHDPFFSLEQEEIKNSETWNLHHKHECVMTAKSTKLCGVEIVQ